MLNLEEDPHFLNNLSTQCLNEAKDLLENSQYEQNCPFLDLNEQNSPIFNHLLSTIKENREIKENRSRVSDLFDSLRFFTDISCIHEKRNLNKIVKSNGGKISYILNKQVKKKNF